VSGPSTVPIPGQTPWTKQISIVASAQSYNTSTPSGKDETDGGFWDDGSEHSVLEDRGGLGRVRSPLVSCD